MTPQICCPINRCGRPLGAGTYMRVVDRAVEVCEEHWQAVRLILPLETPRG